MKHLIKLLVFLIVSSQVLVCSARPKPQENLATKQPPGLEIYRLREPSTALGTLLGIASIILIRRNLKTTK